MRTWSSNNQTSNENIRVNKTFSIDKNISEKFRDYCESQGRSQSKQLTLYMKKCINAII